jgi:ligand-binding sensor protein
MLIVCLQNLETSGPKQCINSPTSFGLNLPYLRVVRHGRVKICIYSLHVGLFDFSVPCYVYV